MREEILKSIKTLRDSEKRRGFVQTIDLIISFKDIDLKKNENKFSEDLFLPKGRGESAKVVVFSDNLENIGCDILSGQEVQRMNKREARKLSVKTDFFLSEAKLMPLIGKVFGQFLAPKNKMPKIIVGDPEKLVENYKRGVRLVLKSSPVVQCPVGKENMDDGTIADNVETVVKFLEGKLPRGRQNINKVLLKFTMSKPVGIKVN